MGFNCYKRNVKCPLFIKAIKTVKGQFIGIECQPTDKELGFDTTRIVRVKTTEDLKDYIEIFCKDMYDTCPYYQMIMGREKR